MSARAADGGLETVVTFLELSLEAESQGGGRLCAVPARNLSPDRYRLLVDAVGRPWHWVDVVRADAAALAARLAEPDRRISLVSAQGVIVGFFEVRTLDPDTVELEYLGLLPEAVGKGLGTTLLRTAIDCARKLGAPRRLVARTCTLDHPAALPLYRRAGFRVVGYQRDRVHPLTPDEVAALAPLRERTPGWASGHVGFDAEV